MVTNFAAGLRQEGLTREVRQRAAVASASSLSRVLGKFFEIWVVESRGPRHL
jgi:purine-nucleoside phosphorylase